MTHPPRFSIVTISFNQAEFLRAAIDSVVSQAGVDVQYIVCDPGSTDGSRALIDSYGDAIALRIYERDKGPSDGLNRGFAAATGEFFGYLNSDDEFLPDAFRRVADYFRAHPDVDVVTGHGWVTDREGKRLRKVWSEPFSRRMVAYGAAVQIQPSTFFRAAAFRRTRGFNVTNRSTWDGELLCDLHLAGARIMVIDEMLSCYRLHGTSITNSGSQAADQHRTAQQRFGMLMGRGPRPIDRPIARALRVWKHLRHPAATIERIRRGPIFMRGVE